MFRLTPDKVVFALGVMLKVSKLKEVKRGGWNRKGSKKYSATKVKKPESIADHLYSSIVLASLLADDLTKDEFKKLVIMLALCDLAAAGIGDRITAIADDAVKAKAEKSQMSLDVMKEYLADYPEYFDLYEEYLNQESNLAKFAKLIKVAETIWQSKQYALDGQEVEVNDFVNSYRPGFVGGPFEDAFENFVQKIEEL